MTCGGVGVRSNTRIKIQPELYGGIPCKGADNMTESCNEGSCPGDYFVIDIKKNIFYYWSPMNDI